MKTINDAIELRQSGEPEQAIKILRSLLENNENDANLNYQLAWCYDVLGREKEAIPHYEKAITEELEEKDQVEAIIGLASTYRTVGAYEKSKTLLEESLKQYDNKALEVFLAMTLYNVNDYEQAVGLLLKLLSETSSDENIQKFSRAIEYYSNKLNQVW